MSSILDTITGGLLPHIRCKKITLENSSKTTIKKSTEFGEETSVIGGEDTSITLQLEVYQEKDKIYQSNWLNDFSVDSFKIIDALFIQVVPFKKQENVIKLLPSNSPLEKPTPGDEKGTVYNAKYFHEDNYLPRGKIGHQGADYFSSQVWPNKVFSPEAGVPVPLQFSKASIVGNLDGPQSLEEALQKGKIKEEIIDGKGYLVLPYEYTYLASSLTGTEDAINNLGFLFYSFLHVPLWFQNLQLDMDPSLWTQYFEELVVEGPVNSEVLFLNGVLQQEREAFFLPDGLPWEGAVHLHGPDNPAPPTPPGYFGDGGFSTGVAPRGWMVGEKHTSQDLPKLNLAKVPNNLISDFRSGIYPEPIDNAMGKMDKDISALNKATAKIEDFLSPFQKEKRKDFVRDNDIEFSKLYVSRDSSGIARGVFFIDTLELLRKNSSLFPILFDQSPPGLMGAIEMLTLTPIDMLSILEKSKLLELKIYRDRVKEKTINTRYEKHLNDKFYEEPSKLIGTISDKDTFKSVTSTATITEIKSFHAANISATDPFSQFKNRYFIFQDREMAKLGAGTYRYRLELAFKDGTYEFLYGLFQALTRNKILLEQYYDMSMSSYVNKLVSKKFEYSTQMKDSEEYSKAMFTKYYKNGSFQNPEFFEFADGHFSDPSKNPSGAKPWQSVPTVLHRLQRVLGLFGGSKSGSSVDFSDASLINLLDPVSGSPKGISFFLSLLEAAIQKTQSLLSATELNKTGSEIDSNSVPSGYTVNNFFDIVVSPSDSTIYEEYTFDHPEELFTAVDNKSVFLDYLSVGQPAIPPIYPARVLSNQYFIDRCRLEAAKWSPLAKTDNGYEGVGVVNNIGIVVKEQGNLQFLQNDSLKNNSFSYLGPSVVSIKSNITNPTRGYNQVLTSFKPYVTAISYINSENGSPTNTLHSGDFLNITKHDKMFMDMVNYFQDIHVDKNLSYGAPKYKHLGMGYQGDQLMSWQQSYKNILEDIGITLHRRNKHDEVFGRPIFPENPGASKNVEFENFEEVFPLSIDEFTDGLSFPLGKMQDFLYSPLQNLTRMDYCSSIPAGYHSYNINYPNSFKYHHIQNSRDANPSHGGNELLHPGVKNVLKNFNIKQTSAFSFFQINLTVKIEVFVGSYTQNAKDDQDAWRLLRNEDVLLPDGEVQFCRMSLFDKRLSQEMELPILDRYFFITSNEQAVMEQPPPVAPTNPQIDQGADLGVDMSFWESKNYLKLNQMLTIMEKGMMKSPTMQVLPAGIETQMQNFSALEGAAATTTTETNMATSTATTIDSTPGTSAQQQTGFSGNQQGANKSMDQQMQNMGMGGLGTGDKGY